MLGIKRSNLRSQGPGSPTISYFAQKFRITAPWGIKGINESNNYQFLFTQSYPLP